jgi:hypothetical protein
MVVERSSRPLTPQATEFLRDARARFPRVQCFDFVPSNYENAWALLDALPRASLCEWGCGLGVVVGLAELLGFPARGVEIDQELADLACRLLADHGLKSVIQNASFFDDESLDTYTYAYVWPSAFEKTLEHFQTLAVPSSRLLLCYGQDDLRVFEKGS